jgi:hypothetical protein
MQNICPTTTIDVLIEHERDERACLIPMRDNAAH